MNHHRHIGPRLVAAQTVQDAPWPTLPIIGIAGHARAGKDTIAQIIQQEYRCMTYAFAEPLKAMLKALGLDAHDLESDRKDEISNDFQATPRHMMQTLGTEWGRDTINSELWVIAAARRLKRMNQGNPDATILITDVRFPNEAAFVRKHGFLVHVERPIQRINASAHRSENPLSIQDSDHIIINDGTLEDLREESLRIACCISNEVSRRLEVSHAS
ncbi:MAG: hypothetical protein RBR43_09510 [Desulfuromonadaceae bacterium]|nr:hypothetical protein [Desulfuromonadaceae bacterium]